MSRDDFRIGMLYAFAASGLNPEDVGNLILSNHEKTANIDLRTLGGAAGGAVGGFIGGHRAQKKHMPNMSKHKTLAYKLSAALAGATGGGIGGYLSNHEKTAETNFSGVANSVGNGLGEIASSLAVGLPLGLGVAGGAAAYSLAGPDYKSNINTMRTNDIINEIRQHKRNVQRSLAKKGIINAQLAGS